MPGTDQITDYNIRTIRYLVEFLSVLDKGRGGPVNQLSRWPGSERTGVKNK